MKNRTPIVYKQVQYIEETDTRTIEERHATLPFVRDEDLPEWEDWWVRTIGIHNSYDDVNSNNDVNNNR